MKTGTSSSRFTSSRFRSMSRRTEMLGSTIQQELAEIILRELNDPRLTGMPSITRVKVSPDLSIADVYVTIMGTPGPADRRAERAEALGRADADEADQGAVAAAGAVPEVPHRREPEEGARACSTLLRKVAEENAELDRSSADGRRATPRLTATTTTDNGQRTTDNSNEERHETRRRTASRCSASCVKEHKPEPTRSRRSRCKALVRGAMSFDVADARADDAMQRDRAASSSTSTSCASPPTWRSRSCSASRYPEIEQRVAMITQALNNIFEREHTLSLDRLKDDQPARRAAVPPRAAGHPPVRRGVRDALRLRRPRLPDRRRRCSRTCATRRSSRTSTSLEDAQKFVEHHLKAEEMPRRSSSRSARRVDGGQGKKKAKA